MILLLVVTEPAAVEAVAAGSLGITAMKRNSEQNVEKNMRLFWYIVVRSVSGDVITMMPNANSGNVSGGRRHSQVVAC